MFPIVDKEAFDSVRAILDLYWRDNNRSRVLNKDGTYAPIEKTNEEENFNAQHFLFESHSGKKVLV